MSVSVTLNSSFVWRLLFNYDNSTNDAEIVQTLSVKLVKSISSTSTYDEVRKSAQSSSTTSSVGANFEITGFNATVGANTKYEVQSNISVENEVKKSVTTKNDESSETVQTASWTIGARSKLAVYQLRYTAPGIIEDFFVFTTTPDTPVTIPVTYYLSPRYFVQRLDVVYGDSPSQMPPSSVQEVSGQSNDINKGFGGKYVWLQVVWTKELSDAATGFLFIKQSGEDKRYQDLAKGAGGDYRYLIPLAQPNYNFRLREVKLFRGDKEITQFPGYDGHTTDINAGRGGTYLYLAWKLEAVITK
mmetsp:Transcript_26962/g.29398  ORF Transcript_26962/g.29398 Transcript_26962/m.29398 type:complete len:302 (-) Transcript_26962:68-973(-)